MFLAYCAMAAVLVPLAFMGIGYMILGTKDNDGS